jgi:hypothetical protein
VLALLLVLAADVLAGGAPAPPPATTDVEIAIAATTTTAAASVREDLQDLLARRGLAARYRSVPGVDRDEVLRPPSESPCALACIWIDLGVAKPARAFVYISATASEQVVIRSLPLPGGVDEVAREEVAHIVASSVEALQAGRPLPVATSAADVALAKSVRAPAAPPPAAAPPTLWLVGLGGGAAHESGAALALPVVGVSLLVGAERRRLAPALWLAAGAFSSDAAGDGVALRFHGGELAALGAIGTRASDGGRRRRVVARLGLGPGVELRDVGPAAAAPGVVPFDARLEANAFVRAAARLEVRLADPVGLFVAAACDARVVTHRYTTERASDGLVETAFEPSRLRPSIVVGLDARLTAEAAP